MLSTKSIAKAIARALLYRAMPFIYKVYEKKLWEEIKQGPIPNHVGLILDGNRRWARRLGLDVAEGHKRGKEKIKEVLRWCWALGIKNVTIYVLSTENFNRSKQEVEALLKLARQGFLELLEDPEIHEKKIRVRAIGKLELLPEDIRELIRRVEAATQNYDGSTLNIAIAYGGRAEIVDAVRKIAEQVKIGKLRSEDINEKLFEQYLYTAGSPDPDLIIRTSGEERLSGFLLWQSAYSELCFLDVYWPEIRRIDFWRAIRTYQRRERRFGR